jgi:glycosyltransferase involved in cell wall biosynthesis
VALNAHNIEFKLFADKAHTTPLKRAAMKHLHRVETECFAGVDLCFVCSEQDREFAIDHFKLNAAHVHLAPNGVDADSVLPATAAERASAKARLGFHGRIVALFVGSRWPPNADAVRELLKIALRDERILYLVVGDVGQDFRGTSSANVRFTGFVDDIQPFFAAADVAVNPMVSGSGSNIKMFEYLAAGLPVISTHFGARGIAEDHTGSVVPVDLENFPTTILKVTESSTELAKRSALARQIAKSRYDWTAISTIISEALLACA